MEFGVGPDVGHTIRAWVLPTAPGETPTLRVDVDGTIVRVQANVRHEDQIAAGRSETGYCGFELTNANVPGLSTATRVTIVEEETGLVILRRRERRSYADVRLYVFESRAQEESWAMRLFSQGFQMFQPGLEGITREARQAYITNMPIFTPSVLVSGSNYLKGDEGRLRLKDFLMTALLADPAQLLFEALMPAGAQQDPDALGLFARELRHLSEGEKAAMKNPLARRLTLGQADVPMRRDAVAVALTTLAELDAVGVEAALPEFVSLVAAIAKVDESLFAVPPPQPPFPLAAALRQDPVLRQLIGMDLDIYDAVADAIMEVRTPSAPLSVVPRR